MQKIYLDNASTTQLTPEVKQYIIELLDQYANPSSLYQSGIDARQIIEQARSNVAKFINGKSDNIIFTSSGSASNSLVIKGLTSENVQLNKYNVFYSPTAHKSMIKACKSCLYSVPLIVSKTGRINLSYLNNILKNEILSCGRLPFYGTSMSHIASQRVALAAGFVPAWAELYCEAIVNSYDNNRN